MIRVMKLGDWVDFSQRVGTVAPELRESAAKSVYDLAVETRAYILWKIASHGFSVARLRPSTVARKGHATPFINTHGYVEHIAVLEDPEGFRVGFEETARNPVGKLYGDIANELEYGNSRMKPRPHWQPTARWVGTRVPGVGASVLSRVSRGG